MKKYSLKLTLIGFLFAAALCFDLLRAPENQISARLYIKTVHVYQTYGRPALDGVVACRFRPTCSDYSIEAVEKYGTAYGLYLTFQRLFSCTDEIPMGTIDAVP